MRAEQMKIVFERDALSAGIALQRIHAVLRGHDVPLIGFALYDEPVSLPSVLPRLEGAGRRTFNLAGQGYEFLLGSVGNYRLDFLRIKSVASLPIPWDEWAAQFIAVPGFVMAWVMDSEYDHWQNAEDPLQYTAAGKPYAHLPMKSNGLPYPVERTIIDTSHNPGRWAFRDGYIEAVGAAMWLGDSFWPLTGADRERVANTPWLRVAHPMPSVTRLQVAEQFFTTAEGASGELQCKARLLLFPACMAFREKP